MVLFFINEEIYLRIGENSENIFKNRYVYCKFSDLKQKAY